MAKLLLHNAIVLTMDKQNTVYDKGYVRVNGNTIEDLGSEEGLSGVDLHDYERHDCKGGILIPGMVNTHTHNSMMVFRSLGDDVQDRLNRYIFPLEKEVMTRETAAAGANYAYAELLLGGVTCVFDAYYYEHDIALAAERAGIRGLFSETIVNFPAPGSPEPYGGIAVMEEFIQHWKGHERIVPAVFSHAMYTNDSEHLKLSHRLARENGVKMGMHVAEMDHEQEACLKEYGKTPVEYLDSLGVLDDNFIAVHCVNLSEGDMDVFASRGVSVSHNPGSNAKAGRKICPVTQLQKRGVTVGLATDGPMSNNTIDIVTQLPLAAKLQKIANHDRCAISAVEALRMATIEGAKVLGLDSVIGSLEKGKRADMAVFETESVNMSPMYDPYYVLVYSANPYNVSLTMVDGEILVKDKALTKTSLSEVRAELLAQQAHISGVAAKL